MVYSEEVDERMDMTDDDDNDDNDDIVSCIRAPKNYHFMWIKNLSRLLSKQISANNHKLVVCDRCLNHFMTQDSLEKHLKYCRDVNKCRLEVPDESCKIMKFKNFMNQEKVPFAIYADLESILEKMEDDRGKNTEHTHKHIPFSIAYYLKCSYDESLSKFRMYRGADCMQWFNDELISMATEINNIMMNIVPMKLSLHEEFKFSTATTCHICRMLFQPHHIKVRDHCHLTGKFRGAAHQQCNLKYTKAKIIPVVFHNLSGYDAHFVIKKIAKGIPGTTSLLPINKERYISFTKYVKKTRVQFRFIDSFRFMARSLDKLSSYLKNEQKPITRAAYDSNEKFQLVTHKGIFPYEYIDSWEKLEEEQLPNQDAFFSTLRNESVNDVNYEHAQKVWDTFNIKTLGNVKI